MSDEEDKYLSVKSISTGIFRDRGSRFLAFAHHVESVEETKELIEKYRKEYHDARHHCYAYIIGPDGAVQRQSDDGEPQGTAGKPILGQISSRNLTNTMVIVVRYFGGTLLGTGGLVNAYKTAASIALTNAEVTESHILRHLTIRFPYSRLNIVMKILSDLKAVTGKQEFTSDCIISAGIRKSLYEHLVNRLREFQDIEIINL